MYFILFIIAIMLLLSIGSFIAALVETDPPIEGMNLELVAPIFSEEVAPLYSTSSHLGMDITSEEFRVYMSEILGLTKLWFQWARENNMRTSLQGGSVIGFLLAGAILPHDDDIDVSLHHDDLKILNNLHKNGTKVKVRIHNELFWDVREVTLQPMNVPMRIAKARLLNGWYKWLPAKNNHWRDIGGLDIMTAVPHANGKWYEMAWKSRRLPSQDNLVPVQFNGFDAYMSTAEEADAYINECYGTRWQREITSASPYFQFLSRKYEL